MKPKKLKTLTELAGIVAREKRRGSRVVLANGCFDLLHVGHIRYLKESAAAGDVLVVALNSDASVRALKGAGRPLLPQAERAEILSALSSVDFVTIFRELNVENILRVLKPDLHAKGSDYTLDTVPERETVKACGGRNVITGGPKVRSTRDVIERISSRKDGNA